MATLDEIKRENEKLRNEIKNKEELISIGRQRAKIIKENKSLMRQQKFGKAIRVGKSFGRGVGKVGVSVGKGLFKLAQRIDENERRRISLLKKSRRISKKTTRKTTRKKTKRRKR